LQRRRLLRVTILGFLAVAGCGRAEDRADSGSNGAAGGAGSVAGGSAGASGGTTGTGGNAAGTGGSTAGNGGSVGGSGVGGAAGSAGAGDCIDLSFTPMGRFDFLVVGSGFDAYEGESVRAFVEMGWDRGHGVAETTIRNGAFVIAMPKTNEPYTCYGIYIDRAGDDACTVNVDPFFQMCSGGVYQDVNWAITPATRYLEGLPACNINGMLDLTRPRSCPV
jgi:hypothetical protein